MGELGLRLLKIPTAFQSDYILPPSLTRIPSCLEILPECHEMTTVGLKVFEKVSKPSLGIPGGGKESEQKAEMEARKRGKSLLILLL